MDESVDAAQGLLRACARSSRSARMLAGRSAWVTGLRREQSSDRARRARSSELDDAGRVKFNPLADWSWADVWHYIARTTCPTTRCTTGSSRASAARRARAPSRSARTSAPAAGGGRTRAPRNAACTSHARRSAAVSTIGAAHERPADRSTSCCPSSTTATSTRSRKKRSSSCARPRPRSSGRRCCSPAARILRRAAAGREGVQARRQRVKAACRSRCCTSTPATTSPR